MRRILFLFAFVPGLALANADRGVVTTNKISTKTPARYYVYTHPQLLAANGSAVASTVYPFARARLVDVIVYQAGAGVGGTSVTVNVRDNAGTSLLATNATITLAAGNHVGVDAKAEMALPAGCTRPVVKTDGGEVVTKGTYVDIYTTEVGAYSTHPSLRVVLVFESYT